MQQTVAAQQVVGPERRERVWHQTWRGEGRVKSRRPVNSDVMRLWLTVILFALIGNGCAPNVVTKRDAPVDSFPVDFVDDFRASRYLELAVAFQALPPQERATRLEAMARDPSRSYEVFPLCRMLFEARDGGVFRSPMLGAAEFVAGTYTDWPLEPITLSDGIPFLIVRGYMLAGMPESAEMYVTYCLANCQWTQRKYIAATNAQIKQALERLISANPSLRVNANWLRLQTR